MAHNDPKNVKLGVCRVYLDGEDLGFTKGGVEVSVETTTHEVQVDQLGQTPVNEYITGRTVTVSCPFAETTLENMVALIPGAKLVTDTVDPTKKRVVAPTGVGISLLDHAKELVLHPIGLPESDKSEDFVVFRASTPGAMSFAYQLEEERVFNTEFKGYPNEDGELFGYGDPSASDL